MQQTSKRLNIAEIQKNHPNVFDCNFYDTILEGLILLFGKRNVTVNINMNRIIVKDRINLQLSISWNEAKIYIHTWIYDCNRKNEASIEIWREVDKQNRSFRLFGIDQIFEYLYIKRDENEFIINNEG